MTEQIVKDLLIAARKKIENEKDWGKGRRFHDRPMNTCCAAEAIEDLTYGESKLRGDAFNVLHRALRIADISIVFWNDAPERTHADVVAAFDRAIELA